ncbi:MAG: protein TolQ [Proteobacteria bacterium]|nr:MAG: protein TolQ [Pseudomonadota bacterium]
MQTPTSHGIFDLILGASFIVQLVMLGLFLASVACWAIILLKRQLLVQAKKQNDQFLQGFWGGWNISEAFTRAADFPLSPVAKSFAAAIRELRKLGEGNVKDATGSLRGDVVVRSLRKANQAEIANLEHSLSWLATTASAAPFVGLFGTVWGIMNSFQGIAASGNASLASVAPGISEALIATAIGLFAAIPAAIAFNALNARVRTQAVALDAFNQDLLNLLQREGAI